MDPKGPSDAAEGCSPLQELEKSIQHQAAFSSFIRTDNEHLIHLYVLLGQDFYSFQILQGLMKRLMMGILYFFLDIFIKYEILSDLMFALPQLIKM